MHNLFSYFMIERIENVQMCVCLYWKFSHFDFESGLKIKFSKFQKILKPVSTGELLELCWTPKKSKIFFKLELFF